MLMDLYVAGSSSCSLSCHSSLCTAFSAAASCCCLIKRHVWFKIKKEVIEIFEKILLQPVWTQEISLRTSLVIVSNSPGTYLEICRIFYYTTRQRKLGSFYSDRPSFVLPSQNPMTLHTNLLFIHLIFIMKIILVFFFKAGRPKNVPLICQTYHQRPAAMTWTVLH